MAAAGYPARPATGDVITGAERHGILHARHRPPAADGALVSAGGRVLCCVGRGETLADASDAAYALVGGVAFDGALYRGDIAAKAIDGEISLPAA